mgnify:CR=1 FL=1
MQTELEAYATQRVGGARKVAAARDASEMARGSNPLERTSVQLMLGVALIALCANSAVDRTEDGVIPPWGRVRFGLRINKERR